MSFQAKRELLAQIAGRYRDASSTHKSQILDEFVAATGYARKYAIRLLTAPPPPVQPITRPRPRYYGKEVQDALSIAWAAANYVCAKRLVPFLPELVVSLERHGHLSLSETTRAQLLSISPATADRLLHPLRAADEPHGIVTTKRGSLLKHQVPVRTFEDWNDLRPGFMEADLVAHCGTRAEGSYLYTLTLTDVATGWTECLALLHRGQEMVLQAVDAARRLIPFPLLGLDTDNGGEFLNVELVAYCEERQLTFTRGRAYKKNDQCYVEQKNGAVVRALVGYDRFEGQRAYRQLNELYRAVRLYVNGFQPSVKLRSKRRVGSTITRIYDRAQTPLQRLVTSKVLPKDVEEQLTRFFRALDPVLLLRQIETLQEALWQHAVASAPSPLTAQLSAQARPVRFDPQSCGLEHVAGSEQSSSPSSSAMVPIDVAPQRHLKRVYRRIKPRVPRTYRTRPDPFVTVWEEVCSWLETAPERTAISLFAQLQEQYPGQYAAGQLRTLQRRVHVWRAQAILLFDRQWLSEELLPAQGLPRPLQAKLVPSDPSRGAGERTAPTSAAPS
ncbi:MAG: integrase catalytic domain-containing protein [Ktedonobacterales bacterium]